MSYLYQFKIILVGDSGVGKSAILYRYVNNKFLEVPDITIGVDFGIRIVKIENVPIKLHIWDTAGQEQFRSVTRQYFRDAVGVLLCYEVTSKKSFDNITNWLEMLKEEEVLNSSIILVGTKSDLAHKRVISTEEGSQLAQKYNMVFKEISSKDNNICIEELFHSLASTIYGKLEKKDIEIDNLGVKVGLYVDDKDIVDTSAPKKRCC